MRVSNVIDGDTLALAEGRKLRLIGIDTPELGREGAPDEPFARAAQAEVRRFLGGRSAEVRVLPGIEPEDRHRRLLAHVFDGGGRNLSEHLLRQGLAYQVTVPPNERLSDCYQGAESEARRLLRGLWRFPPLEAADLPKDVQGFRRIAGRAGAVAKGKGATRIDLDGALTLRIANADLHRFDRAWLAEIPGRRVEVRGWVYSHHGRPQLRLRHPSSLRLD
jgi:endonuclease YncB( thermonuclease family)